MKGAYFGSRALGNIPFSAGSVSPAGGGPPIRSDSNGPRGGMPTSAGVPAEDTRLGESTNSNDAIVMQDFYIRMDTQELTY